MSEMHLECRQYSTRRNRPASQPHEYQAYTVNRRLAFESVALLQNLCEQHYPLQCTVRRILLAYCRHDTQQSTRLRMSEASIRTEDQRLPHSPGMSQNDDPEFPLKKIVTEDGTRYERTNDSEVGSAWRTVVHVSLS